MLINFPLYVYTCMYINYGTNSVLVMIILVSYSLFLFFEQTTLLHEAGEMEKLVNPNPCVHISQDILTDV